ncbi:MAG: nickel pincer cofactor biosynthesis protein LarC [Ruminococcaceae bacterium]|nr:nickel pincer cofactor biosynthesis protein LarC [Oscillospiraceae bacterium]
MRTLYLECSMGAAGDMLLAALLELIPDPDGFIAQMNAWKLPDVHITRETAVKCGITGTHVSVTVAGAEETSQDVHSHEHAGHDHTDHHHACAHGHNATPHMHDHHHIKLDDIHNILSSLPVSNKVKADALAVYTLIAEAEAKAHGKPVDAVHFHEVGMLDAVADIVGVCALVEQLAPECIVASPVHVGSGQVRCAHGILPVPAPATASILLGVPTYGGAVRGELCTPTGAALLKHFVQAFGPAPLMTTTAIGYGMGKKDFPMANCVRAFLGDQYNNSADTTPQNIVELACSLDDMPGEDLAFALETLLEQGALDTFLLPVQMKKNRPGQLLVCLCRPEDETVMAALILRHTSSFGLRSVQKTRHTLARSMATVQTACGPVQVKTGSGYGTTKSKPEYEDLARMARTHNLTLAEARALLQQNTPNGE